MPRNIAVTAAYADFASCLRDYATDTQGRQVTFADDRPSGLGLVNERE